MPMPTLADTIADLQAHFCHEPHWWPLHHDDRPFEVTVGMVLVQQTRWEAVEAAVLRLLATGITSFARLADADPHIVATLCRPCAFYSRKGAALVALARQIVAYPGGMTALLAAPRTIARQQLLALPQIGRESADTILLYAGDVPLFIVDAYARRFLSRSGIIASAVDAATAPYDVVQAHVEALFPLTDAGAARELHAMMVEVCIHHCTATHPRCRRTGAHRSFVDVRKCADHCRNCHACPAQRYCRHANTVTG